MSSSWWNGIVDERSSLKSRENDEARRSPLKAIIGHSFRSRQPLFRSSFFKIHMGCRRAPLRATTRKFQSRVSLPFFRPPSRTSSPSCPTTASVPYFRRTITQIGRYEEASRSVSRWREKWDWEKRDYVPVRSQLPAEVTLASIAFCTVHVVKSRY